MANRPRKSKVIIASDLYCCLQTLLKLVQLRVVELRSEAVRLEQNTMFERCAHLLKKLLRINNCANNQNE